jgi:hypothetical protein
MHTTIDYVAAYAATATALGTLGLATATYALARKTRDMAKSAQQAADAARQELELLAEQADASKRQSQAAEQAFRASIKPVLVQASQAPRGTISPEGELLVVPVKNIGAGIARFASAGVAYSFERQINIESVSPSQLMSEWSSLEPAPLPQGEEGQVFFTFETQPDGFHCLSSNRDLFVRITYTDLSGAQRATSLFQLRRLKQSGEPDDSPQRTYVCAPVEIDVSHDFVAGS